jgi:GT2 family glycosyltransferase
VEDGEGFYRRGERLDRWIEGGLYVAKAYHLSIVIPNWNARELLQNCVRSVSQETRNISLEIIVVDNDSSDGSQEMISSRFPEVRLIENDRNRGFAKASNQGIEVARGRYILLLNSDTVILDGALDKMVRFMDLHLACGICGPKILNPDGSLQSMGRQRKGLFQPNWSATADDPLASLLSPFESRFEQSRRRGRDPDEIADVDVVSGACLLIRRKVLGQIGLLDEEFQIYNEEDDLCRRVKEAGWGIRYLPQAEVIHHKGMTIKWAQIAPEIPVKAYRGKIGFHRKYHGTIAVLLLRLLLKATTFLEMVAYTIRYLVSPFGGEKWERKIRIRWQQLKCMA